MSNPSPIKPFDHLIKKTTLEIIYRKFQQAEFTSENVITRVYWLCCIQEHVQYMERRGWIKKVSDKPSYRFVVQMGEWVYGGDVY